MPDQAERQRLGRSLLATTDRLGDDRTVPLSDRVWTASADIDLGKAANGNRVPPAVLAQVRARMAAVDKAAIGRVQRQSVVPRVAEMLDAAGDVEGAIRYLKANLASAEAPAYDMDDIAEFEEELGSRTAAVDWERRSFEAAEGSATRVQSAINYADMAMKMLPGDRAAVERGANAVLTALREDEGNYSSYVWKKTQAWTGRLAAWSTKKTARQSLRASTPAWRRCA